MGEHTLLTTEKLLHILQTSEGTKDVSITKHSVRPGTEAGENFASELSRVEITATVNGKEKEYHWMVKMTPENNTSFTMGAHMEENEITYYRDIIPAWNRMAKEKGASFRINNLPAPYTELYPEEEGAKRSILVMEDLACHGYKDAINKKKGYSLAHAKVALEEIARFHALSHSYIVNYPGGMEKAKEDNKIFMTDYTCVEANPVRANITRSLVEYAAFTLDLIQEPGQNFGDIYRKFLEENDALEYSKMIMAPNPDGFNVICHSDLWFNNMLFK